MNPQYKIHGKDRRNMKKELSLLKKELHWFWYCHDTHKEMTGIYGGECMSDDDAEAHYTEIEKKVERLESALAVPYSVEEA